MTQVEQFALKSLMDKLETEKKMADKQGVAYHEQSVQEQNAEKKAELLNESYFSRGLACGYALSLNSLKELIEAAKKDGEKSR